MNGCHPLHPLLLQEGPHSALNEDEFFDALEMAYKDDEIEHTVVSYSVHVIIHCIHTQREWLVQSCVYTA